MKEVEHESWIYGVAQREKLMADLSAHGWTVSVEARACIRPPESKDKCPWVCYAYHPGWVKRRIETRGFSLWDCLSKVVEKINAAYTK